MAGNDLDLYKIALTKIDMVGAVMARQLVSYCGGIKEVFELNKKELLKIPQVGLKVTENILTGTALKSAEAELEFIEKEGINFAFYLDSHYPERLKHYPDSPTIIYYKGSLNIDKQRTVGIVGTRTPSENGKINCEKLVEELKPYGAYIISGLAHGIDSIAHKTAVQHDMPTIGILGHGLHMLYPAQNRKLASRMLDQGGAIVSEFGNGTKPDKPNFPMRNRVIAALSDAVIIVESARKGGSIITTVFANDYNKDVFAIPGRLSDEFSQGCNMLIKQHKAALIESAADIGYIMNWEVGDQKSFTQASLFYDLNTEEQIIVDLLKEHKELSADQLHYRTQLPHSKLSAILLNLEFNGILRSLPGKKYILYS